MAKVNLWLRGARGKFAGASLSKGTNGETIAREVVTPANPNTDKQLYQRMIMATVMAAFSAGKEIFDHSFQGKTKGSECQQEFMTRNLYKLRLAVSQDINAIAAGTRTEGTCKTIVVGPRTHNAVPGAFEVSAGTYDQNFFSIMTKTPTANMPYEPTIGIKPSVASETVAQYAKRCGLIPGDIYTLVALSANYEADPVWVGVDTSGNISGENWDNQLPCYFQFWRLQVKDEVLTDNTTFSYNAAGALAKLFNLTDLRIIADDNSNRLSSPVSNDFVCADATAQAAAAGASTICYDYNFASFGIIRSRYDQDLRSNTTMKTFIHLAPTGQSDPVLEVGISAGSALRQWRHGISIGGSDLVLESNT